MRIIAVDDERLAVEYIRRLLYRVEPQAEFAGFTEPDEAFADLLANKADIALLDIEMGEYSGIELAKRCKERCPTLNVIFVTGHSQYTLDAFRLHASGYLMKPVRADDLRAELNHLRHPVPLSPKHRVKIQTFGNFEIYVNQKPLNIPAGKCRECLAYLVDRKGARVTAAELAAVLWEDQLYDKRVQNNTHRVMSDTMRYLKEAKVADIILRSRGEMAIDTENVDCDYFRFLRGDVSQINAFQGEYMANYGWAEFTLGILTKKINSG